MKDCEDNHATCRAPNTKFMPSRVIDVGSQGTSDVICLVEPKVYDPYIALSYCWGTTKRSWLVTTKENIKDHRRSIPLNRLPWTLFNAINFTRRLGIRYIWIDSLCIVQDDKIDWTTEAAKMSHVYFHATLVISANSTPDCTIPSFHRQLYGSRPCQATFRPRFGFEPCNEVYVRSSSIANHRNLGRVNRPRDSRGWCFQETVLARRELQLTTFEMQWTCAEIEKCECLERHPTPIPGLLKALKASSRLYFKQPTNEHPNAEELYKIWRIITLLYTQRAFTNQSDKLVAISSLAHVIKGALKEAHGIEETYLAGLWKGDLARGLLWCIDFQVETMGQRRGHLGTLFMWRFINSGLLPAVLGNVLDIRDIFVEKLRNCFWRLVNMVRKADQPTPNVQKPRMLTWSWASTSLPVSYFHGSTSSPRTYFLPVQSPLLEAETFRSEIEIHEAKVETSPLNSCGPAESGHIKLTGQMVEVRLRTLPAPSIEYQQRRIGPYCTPINRLNDLVSFVCTESGAVQECILDSPIMKACPPLEENNWDCWFGFDGPQCSKTDCSCRRGWPMEPYWCLKIGTFRCQAKQGHIILIPSWLVLKKSEGREGVYERVGIGSAERVGRSPCYFHLFNESQKAMITIV
jgi:Heterokaryon incompatibility protein (HET)